jgi:hypothetical protein
MTLHLKVLPQFWNGEVPRFLCEDEPRPCKREGCRYHLWGEITTDKRSQPGRYGPSPRITEEERKVRPSCAIDVADDGPKSLGEIAKILGLSREGVRVIESRGMAKMERHGASLNARGLPDPRSRY